MSRSGMVRSATPELQSTLGAIQPSKRARGGLGQLTDRYASSLLRPCAGQGRRGSDPTRWGDVNRPQRRIEPRCDASLRGGHGVHRRRVCPSLSALALTVCESGEDTLRDLRRPAISRENAGRSQLPIRSREGGIHPPWASMHSQSLSAPLHYRRSNSTASSSEIGARGSTEPFSAASKPGLESLPSLRSIRTIRFSVACGGTPGP